MKYIVICGGVVSGLGKGTTISSIGVILKDAGLRVSAIKIDPYLNVDAGTMSPFEHGEVFVLGDGGETDLDLGNYERFLEVALTAEHNVTTGKVYQRVIARERRGDYLGKTVQVVPHVTDAVQDWLERVARVPVDGESAPPDVCLVELGGTVGDIESSHFLEALRQFQFRVGADNFCLCHMSLVPSMSDGAQKTKPTQHGVMELRRLGLTPDLIFCRSGAQPLTSATRAKIGLFCQIAAERVLSVHDVPSVYHVPPLIAAQGVYGILADRLRLAAPPAVTPGTLRRWHRMLRRVDACADPGAPAVRIAVVGKYVSSHDAYFSVSKALRHAATAAGLGLRIEWIEAAQLEAAEAFVAPGGKGTACTGAWARLRACHGVLVPGGFGARGVEGKIAAVRHARLARTPFLGVCLGLQCAVIEHCRGALGWGEAAHSTEFAPETATPAVMLLPESGTDVMGGTMRLGARRTRFAGGGASLASALYGGRRETTERHRQRYEVAPAVVRAARQPGQSLRFTGVDADSGAVTCLELPAGDHPYFFATQFHPEYRSTAFAPSPPYVGLLLSAAAGLHDREAPARAPALSHEAGRDALRLACAAALQAAACEGEGEGDQCPGPGEGVDGAVFADFVYQTANDIVRDLAKSQGNAAYVRSLRAKAGIPAWRTKFEQLMAEKFAGPKFDFEQLRACVQAGTVPPRYRDVSLALYDSLKEHYV
jgi:CTP synthase